MIDVKGVSDMIYFTKGHRGILYTGKYKGKKVVVKAKLPSSLAIGRIENEGNWLKRLNKVGVGPKLIFACEDYFFYSFVEGEFFIDFVKKLEKGIKSKKKIIGIIDEVLKQCFELDKLNVDKEEMHHPLKHVLIDEKFKVTLLDFERCHIVEYPKNVTQFVVFLMRAKEFLSEYMIKIDQDDLIALSKVYKREQTKENLDKILNSIK
jgi:putative serine/threonine protein kinase